MFCVFFYFLLMQNIFLEKKFHTSTQKYSLALFIFWQNPTSFRMRAPFLLLAKQDDTVLSVGRSWFKCLISWISYERRWWTQPLSATLCDKLQDKEEVFMPYLLSLPVVLNCSEQSMSSPIFNALAITALDNRFIKWYSIHSLFAVNMYNAKNHVNLSLLPERTLAVHTETKAAVEKREVRVGIMFAGIDNLEGLLGLKIMYYSNHWQ